MTAGTVTDAVSGAVIVAVARVWVVDPTIVAVTVAVLENSTLSMEARDHLDRFTALTRREESPWPQP